MGFTMSDVTKRFERLEKGHEKLEKVVTKQGEVLHEHDTAIKLHDKDLESVVNGMSSLEAGLNKLNTTVVEQVVPMMNDMTTAKKTKAKLEAKIGKTIMYLIGIIGVSVSSYVAFFKQ